jgi:K+-sensing histidine kinase KdpD
MVVTVQADAAPPVHLVRYRILATQLGASFAVLGGSDVAAAVVQAARDSGVEHVVVGEMTAASIMDRLRPTIVDQIIDRLPESDIHVIARLAK